MNKPDIDETWLGPILECHLGPVSAPGELEGRIEAPRLPSRSSTRRLAWSLAAAMVLVAIVWGFHLRGATATLEVPSAYHVQLRASLRTNTGFDVPFATRRAASCLLCHIGPVDPSALN
jgi:hypothetical protein